MRSSLPIPLLLLLVAVAACDELNEDQIRHAHGREPLPENGSGPRRVSTDAARLDLGPTGAPDAAGRARDGRSRPLADSAVRVPPIEWVELSGGAFTMGAEPLVWEQPLHRVVVPAFYISRSEVTVGQYRALWIENGRPAALEPNSGGTCNWNVRGRDEHPVNCIDWESARTFADWVGRGTRLPSEAEWEYAARSGGLERRYPWGNGAPTCDLAHWEGPCPDDHGTLPVCSRRAGDTEQGVCDMAGNVWEWLEDCHHCTYDCWETPGDYSCAGASPRPDDGTAWVGCDDVVSGQACFGGGDRGGRGGSWTNNASSLRTTDRGHFTPDDRHAVLGFRLVRPR